MVNLYDGFRWDIFDCSKFDGLGLQYNFGMLYDGDGYWSKPINNMDSNEKRAFKVWKQMIRNCYGSNRNKLSGTICEEWKDFINFKKWYDENYYELENERVIFSRSCFDEYNTHYSPETCIFAPCRVVKLLKVFGYGADGKNTGMHGEILPKYIYYSKKFGCYYSHTTYNGEHVEVGVSDNILELQAITKKVQKTEILRIAKEYKDKIPKRLYERMQEFDYNIGEVKFEKM